MSLHTVLTLIGEIQIHIPWLFPLYAFILGSVLGSFANCVRYRIPHGISLRRPPSQCDVCHRRLTLPDLIPIVSYIILKGKCRTCQTKIGVSSLIVELVYAIAFAIYVSMFGVIIGGAISLLFFALTLPLLVRYVRL